ncbi:MAG: hypothetical protein ACI9SK_001934 [Zhongshania sp.]|jgi:hypothetical protein
MRTLILLPLILLLLTACSSASFVYKRADWFINWAVDDYVSFDREQQTLFDAALDDWLDWHCSAELPRYGEYLRNLSAALSKDELRISDASLLGFADRASEAWIASLSRALIDASGILESLSDEQLAQFIEELDSRNKQFQKEYVALNATELEKLRVERVRDAMKRWAGSIDDGQQQLALEWARSSDNIYGLIFNRRLHWRDRLQEIFSKRPYDNFKADLTELFLRPELLLTNDERGRLVASQQSARGLLQALDRSLSKRQREHLLAELDEIKDDITHLSTSDCGSAQQVDPTQQ